MSGLAGERMTTLIALLDALLLEPWPSWYDGTRLVLADCLEEAGDPRAEGVRGESRPRADAHESCRRDIALRFPDAIAQAGRRWQEEMVRANFEYLLSELREARP